MKLADCELCASDGGQLVMANEWLRVVLIDDADFPGFTRVIWNDHVRELTDLEESPRKRLMHTVFAVESALREVLRPDKMNVASLGNVTPHVHWHVIPRYADDSRFPLPIWGPTQRSTSPDVLAARRKQVGALRARIAELVARVPR